MTRLFSNRPRIPPYFQPSYIMDQDGTTVWAVNADTGVQVASGLYATPEDVRAVIQACIDAAPGNNAALGALDQPTTSIFFKRGRYISGMLAGQTYSLDVNNKCVSFIGESWKGTQIVQVASAVQYDLFYVHGGTQPSRPNNANFSHIQLDGQLGLQAGADRAKALIRIEDFTKDMIWDRLYVQDGYGNGVYCAAGVHNDMYWLDSVFENCWSGHTFNAGGYYRFIKGCYWYGNNATGLVFKSGSQNILIGNSWYYNNYHGLQFTGQICDVISGNAFRENNRAGGNYDHLVLSGVGSGADYKMQHSIVADNMFREGAAGTVRYSIYLGGNIDSVLINSNDLAGYGTAPIGWSGSIHEVEVKDNHGCNPLGIIANPFDNAANVVELVGAAAGPTNASTDYTVKNCDIFFNSTGGTGVNITIEDPASTVMSTPGATATREFVPIGYIINFGAFTVAPTVTVWGN